MSDTVKPASERPFPGSNQKGRPSMKSALRRVNMTVLATTGLQDHEVSAITNVMSTAEMLQTVARLAEWRRAAEDTAAKRKHHPHVVATCGLSAPEAEALTLALTDHELETTITRVGLSVVGAVGDREELQRRASIALRHPVMSCDGQLQYSSEGAAQSAASMTKEQATNELALRAAELEELENMEIEAIEDTPLDAGGDDKEQPEAEDEDEDLAAGGEILFGGKVWCPDMLDEFMLTSDHAGVNDEEWESQLLLLFNTDRAAEGEGLLPARPRTPHAASPWRTGLPFDARTMHMHCTCTCTYDARARASTDSHSRACPGLPPLEGSLDQEMIGEAAIALGRERSGETRMRPTTQALRPLLARLRASDLLTQSHRCPYPCARLSARPVSLSRGKSAWKLWESEPAETAARAGEASAGKVSEAVAADARATVADDYEAFFNALPRRAKEMLEDLYDLGILRKHDEVARQARYVKAIVATEAQMVVSRQEADRARRERRNRRKHSQHVMFGRPIKGGVATVSCG